MITTASRTALEQAEQFLRGGRGTEAAAVAKTHLAQSPDDGRFIQLLGLAWYAEGRLRSARHAFETALFLAPLRAEALLALAEIYASLKRPRDARVSLTLLAERTDLAAELLPRVAALAGRLGDPRLALALCRRSIELDPDCDEALFGAAYYMRRLEFPAEMIAAVLRRAVHLDPDCCLYRRTLASLLASMNELSEACELYRSIEPEQVCCRGCLQTMIEVFDRLGHPARRDACLARLERLQQEAHGSAPSVENSSLEPRE